MPDDGESDEDELYLSVSLALTATGRKVLFVSVPAEVEGPAGERNYVQAKLVLEKEDAVRLIDGLVGGLEAGLGFVYEKSAQTAAARAVCEVANAKVNAAAREIRRGHQKN